MKKALFTLGLAMAGLFTQAPTASAQRLRIGPEIGLNLSNAYYNYDGYYGDDRGFYSTVGGLRLGGVLDARIGRHFAIQPGIFYNQKGFRTRSSGDDYKIRVNYVELPLYLHFIAPGRMGNFYIGGGPYLAAVVGGYVRNEDGRYSNDLNVGDRSGRDDIRGGDAGLNFDLGYQWRNGFFLRGQAGMGLVNTLPDGNSNASERNHTLSFSAGWLFGGHMHRPHRGPRY